jgi:hypothetical protein
MVAAFYQLLHGVCKPENYSHPHSKKYAQAICTSRNMPSGNRFLWHSFYPPPPTFGRPAFTSQNETRTIEMLLHLGVALRAKLLLIVLSQGLMNIVHLVAA